MSWEHIVIIVLAVLLFIAVAFVVVTTWFLNEVAKGFEALCGWRK